MELTRRRVRRWIKWAVGVLGGGLVSASLTVSGLGLVDHPQRADVAVILGARVQPDGAPSQRLRDRLQRGLDLFRSGTVSHLLVSGGLGAEGWDEAEVMANWLIARGVPPERVLRDPQGWTTWHTARNAGPLLRAHGLGSVVVVTTYYHLPRTELAFRRVGLEPAGTARARFRPGPRDLYAIPRELLGLVWYAVRSV